MCLPPQVEDISYEFLSADDMIQMKRLKVASHTVSFVISCNVV